MQKVDDLKTEFNSAVLQAITGAASVYADSVRREIHANYESMIGELRDRCEKLGQQLEVSQRTACRLILQTHNSATLISNARYQLSAALNIGLHASRRNLEALLQQLNTQQAPEDESPGLVPYLIVHSHRHGISTHFVLSRVDLGATEVLKERAAVAGLSYNAFMSDLYASIGIDFEPEADETIEHTRLDLAALDVSQWAVFPELS